MEPLSDANRYKSLDHWRGLAALSVVIFHGFSPWLDGGAPLGLAWLADVASRGYLGVHVFFVISGYCITQLGFRAVKNAPGSIHFLCDRMLRIFPTYWMACLIAAIMAIAALPLNHQPLLSHGTTLGAIPVSVGALFSNFFLLDPYFDQRSYLTVAWTLCWEVSFYFFAAILIVIARRTSGFLAIALGVFSGALGTMPTLRASLPLIGGWTEFVCGGCLFLALTARKQGRPVWPSVAAIIALAAVGGLQTRFVSQLSFAAGIALVLAFLHRFDAGIAAAQGTRWLGWIGGMSYSLYLLHIPILSPLRNLLGRLIPMQSPFFLTAIVVGVAAATAGSWLFFLKIEAPLERWRRARSAPPSGSAISL